MADIEKISGREFKERAKVGTGRVKSLPGGEGVADLAKMKKDQAKAKKNGPPYRMREKKVMVVGGKTYLKDPVEGWVLQPELTDQDV